MLARHFAQRVALRQAIDVIRTETMESLTRYDWPGNIRELQNIIERAAIPSTRSTLAVPLTPLGATGHTACRLTHRGPPPAATETLEQATRRHIRRGAGTRPLGALDNPSS